MFTQTITRALSRLSLDQRGGDPYPRQPAPMLLGLADKMLGSPVLAVRRSAAVLRGCPSYREATKMDLHKLPSSKGPDVVGVQFEPFPAFTFRREPPVPVRFDPDWIVSPNLMK